VAIHYHPKVGQILMCDFTKGFKEPEMVKKRPALVISSFQGRGKLITVVCLSTTLPNPVMNFHYLLPKTSLPQVGRFQTHDTWVKADMIYTVGFDRLNLIQLGKHDTRTGKRLYFLDRLGREQMKAIYSSLLHGINLGKLAQHL